MDEKSGRFGVGQTKDDDTHYNRLMCGGPNGINTFF